MNRKLSAIDESWQTSFTELEEKFSTKFQNAVDDNATSKRLWEDHMDLLRQNLVSDSADQHAPSEASSSSSCSNRDNDIESLVNKLHDLDCRIVECEQYSRRDCFIISGIPNSVKHGFELENTVISIVSQFGINLRPDDIVACHRLQKKRGSRFPANVIVKFVNRKIVEIVLSHLENLQYVRENLGFNVRIHESL